MGSYSIVTLLFVVTIFGVSMHCLTWDQLKECVVDSLDKSLQPEYLQNPCRLVEESVICVLIPVVAIADPPETTIQTIQRLLDSNPVFRECNLNARQLIQEAKNPSQNTTDDDLSPESGARREALGVCVDDMIAKAQRNEYLGDPCGMTNDMIPCLVNAMSPNGEPSDEVIQGLEIGLNSQDSYNCNFDVRKVLADEGNAAPAYLSGPFWGTLVMSSLSVLLLARGL